MIVVVALSVFISTWYCQSFFKLCLKNVFLNLIVISVCISLKINEVEPFSYVYRTFEYLVNFLFFCWVDWLSLLIWRSSLYIMNYLSNICIVSISSHYTLPFQTLNSDFLEIEFLHFNIVYCATFFFVWNTFYVSFKGNIGLLQSHHFFPLNALFYLLHLDLNIICDSLLFLVLSRSQDKFV